MTATQVPCPRPVHRSATEEQLDRLDQAVSEHNKGLHMASALLSSAFRPGTQRWAEISVTGKLSEYYTLWRMTQGIGISETLYVKNVCKDIEDLIAFVKECRFPYPIDVVPTPTLKNGYRSYVDGVPTMPIGKYRGAKLEDIFKSDPQYIVWFSKNYKSDAGRLSQKDIDVLAQARVLVELFWKEKTEANRQTCMSQFIGTLKKRMEHSGVVIFCRNMGAAYDGETVSYKVDLQDENGNLFYLYSKVEMEKGQTFRFKGTPTQHKEIVGRKKTYFNRVSEIS